TPDVIENPHLKRYLWIRPSENFKIIRRFNAPQGSWDPIGFGEGTLNGSSIETGTITLDKLAPSPSHPQPNLAFYLIRVNATGTGLEFWPLSFQTNSIQLTALKWNSVNDRSKILQVSADGATIRWTTFESSFTPEDNSIAISKLQHGAPNDFLVTKPDGITIAWEQFDVNKIPNNAIPVLKLKPGTNGQILKTENSIAAWSNRTGTLGAYARIVDEKNGVEGGMSSSFDPVKRDLIATTSNQDAIVTIGADKKSFKLKAGSYYIRASAPAWGVKAHVIKLEKDGASEPVIVGTMAYCGIFGTPTDSANTRSEVTGQFDAIGTETFSIMHYFDDSIGTVAGGLGKTGVPSVPCIYTVVELWRIE
ncbi:MAG TPA: hypothetical protein VL854_05720, partial [Nitrososphaeraceae archaeon]|nr:hypothetical protein [Nitrososphaeraceae archaeon]